MNERERIGARIAELRKAKGTTQTQLAELTGIGQGHIARIEQGKYNFKLETLEKLADAFNSHLDFVPVNEEERVWVEACNATSKIVIETLKQEDEKNRFAILKSMNYADFSLMDIAIVSLKNKEYAIFEIANRLLKERGFEFNPENLFAKK